MYIIPKTKTTKNEDFANGVLIGYIVGIITAITLLSVAIRV